jgi:hypothetical protein
MSLSTREQRILAVIEERFARDDPKLAALLSTWGHPRHLSFPRLWTLRVTGYGRWTWHLVVGLGLAAGGASMGYAIATGDQTLGWVAVVLLVITACVIALRGPARRIRRRFTR